LNENKPQLASTVFVLVYIYMGYFANFLLKVLCVVC